MVSMVKTSGRAVCSAHLVAKAHVGRAKDEEPDSEPEGEEIVHDPPAYAVAGRPHN